MLKELSKKEFDSVPQTWWMWEDISLSCSMNQIKDLGDTKHMYLLGENYNKYVLTESELGELRNTLNNWPARNVVGNDGSVHQQTGQFETVVRQAMSKAARTSDGKVSFVGPFKTLLDLTNSRKNAKSSALIPSSAWSVKYSPNTLIAATLGIAEKSYLMSLAFKQPVLYREQDGRTVLFERPWHIITYSAPMKTDELTAVVRGFLTFLFKSTFTFPNLGGVQLDIDDRYFIKKGEDRIGFMKGWVERYIDSLNATPYANPYIRLQTLAQDRRVLKTKDCILRETPATLVDSYENWAKTSRGKRLFMRLEPDAYFADENIVNMLNVNYVSPAREKTMEDFLGKLFADSVSEEDDKIKTFLNNTADVQGVLVDDDEEPDTTGGEFSGDFGDDATSVDTTDDEFSGDFGDDATGVDTTDDEFSGDFGGDTTSADTTDDDFVEGDSFDDDGYDASTVNQAVDFTGFSQEEKDVYMAYSTHIESIMTLYALLYDKDLHASTRYLVTGVFNSEKSSQLILKGFGKALKNADGTIQNSRIFNITDDTRVVDVPQEKIVEFQKAMGALWHGKLNSPNVTSKSYTLQTGGEGLPTDKDNIEWVDKLVDGNAGWLPFVHLALARHFYPWELGKALTTGGNVPKTHTWGEMSGEIRKWLTRIFEIRVKGLMDDAQKKGGGLIDDNELKRFADIFKRHFMVLNAKKSLTFSVYFGSDISLDEASVTSFIRDNSDGMSATGENVLVACQENPKFRSLYNCNYIPSVSDFSSNVLFGYELFQEYLQAHNNQLNPSQIPIGKTLEGKLVNLNLVGGTDVFPLTIRAAGRSGKGVLTQELMIAMLGLGIPFVYFDCKPDMSKVWYSYGERHGLPAFTSDLNATPNTSFLPSHAWTTNYLNPCMGAVLNTPSFIQFLDVIYFGKLVNLISGLLTARASAPQRFKSNHTFIIIDEINSMGGRLKGYEAALATAMGSCPIFAAYKSAKDVALKEYKARVGGGSKDKKTVVVALPKEYKLAVPGVAGEFTVAEWESVFGVDGKGAPLENAIENCIKGIGSLAETLVTTGPKFNMCAIYIGQETQLNKASTDDFNKIITAFRSQSRTYLYGKGWKNLPDGEAKDVVDALKQTPNSSITEGTNTAGLFAYRKSGSRRYQIIKTGAVLGVNDVASINFDDADRSVVGTGHNCYKMLDRVCNNAGYDAAKLLANNKMRVSKNTARMLKSAGMEVAPGQPNPLVSFDGLLDFIAASTHSDIVANATQLKLEFDALLVATTAGYNDVYEYLADPSVMYNSGDFAAALKNGRPLLSSSGTGTGSTLYRDAQGSTGAPRTPQTTPTTIYQPDAGAKYHENPIKQQQRDDALVRKLHTRADIGNVEDVDVDESGRAVPVGPAPIPAPTRMPAPAPTPAPTRMPTPAPMTAAEDDSWGDGFAEGPTDTSAPTPMPAPMPTPAPAPTKVRKTAAPEVVGNNGAASRFGGGPEPYQINPDGSLQLAIPGGRSNGHYTASQTIAELNSLFTEKSAANLSGFALGRKYMLAQSMQRIAEIITRQTGLSAMNIKSLEFSDNCMWVRDTCIIGGQPDSNDLYDYIDLKILFKKLRGLTNLILDRDAYYTMVVRCGYTVNDLFKFSSSLKTVQIDTCTLLRDGRVVGEEINAAEMSFLSDFDNAVEDNSFATGKSKMMSVPRTLRAERAERIRNTPEYTQRAAKLAQKRRDLMGDKADKFLDEGKPIRGIFASVQMWLLDRKYAKLMQKLENGN